MTTMMRPQDDTWTVIRDTAMVRYTQVFLGGACKLIDDGGEFIRNSSRDSICNWLTQKDIRFFDTQLFSDTDSCEYDYRNYFKLVEMAREQAVVNFYEISPRNFGALTALEIFVDHLHHNKPMVIFFSSGSQEDRIPDHTDRGYPLFVPYGIHYNENSSKANYKELVTVANNMRDYTLRIARQWGSLTITFSGRAGPNDIVLTPDRIHASDILTGIVLAGEGQRVFVHFDDATTNRDEKGNPLINLPTHPREMEMHALLDQYVDEGNELRKRVSELVRNNAYVRIVYSVRAAILALEELLQFKRVMN